MSIKVNPQKKYRQTKLSLRLGKSIDLTFHLNNQGEAHFFQQSVKDEVYLFQVKWPEMDQLLNITCDKKIYQTFQIVESTTISSNKISTPDQLKKNIKTKLNPTLTNILKSHLQKNIRQQQTKLALQTTIDLIDGQQLIPLLRRLPIIVVEDTYLFRKFPTLIWLMTYYGQNKTQTLNQYWRLWILQLVILLCQETKIKDTLGKLSEFNLKTELKKLNNLSTEDQALIYALQLRKVYGGMNCDQQMLNWFSYVWSNRLLKKSDESIEILDRNWPKINLQLIDQLKPLSIKNFNLAAVDFHPCPQLLTNLKKIYPEFSIDQLKSSIWYASSCINTREEQLPLMPDDQFIWDTIQDDLERMVIKILYPLIISS